MRKLLALVLALVMTLGLATVATNAADSKFADESSISLKEAAEVMAAVGVFQGNENKQFMPTANLDRASAAKLIAYLDLGDKTAESLPALQVFDDVPASHWAAKYIAYCADAGYIAGNGAGQFTPSGELTGYAFGKMVLCVLGYDAKLEGFTGSSWQIGVAKLMDSNDIADGVSAAPSAALTREQAAQYCLNALKADMVEYSDKGTTVTAGDVTVVSSAKKATKVESKKIDDYRTNAGDKDDVQQLAEKLYGTDLKLTNETDAFGAPALTWKYKTNDANTYPDVADGSYKGKVTKGALYTLVGKSLADDLKAGTATLKIFEDGVNNPNGYAYADGFDKNSTGKAFGTDKGMITEVFINDDNTPTVVTVVIKNTYLMQAASDYNSKTEKLTVTTLAGPNVKELKLEDFAIEGYKEDDYILYTYSKDTNEVKTIEKATLVSGAVDSYATEDSVTIAGTKYSYSAQTPNTKDGKKAEYKTKEVATVVLDAQGNVIYVDEATAANDNIIFVRDFVKRDFGDDYDAEIITTDGKEQIVQVNANKSADWVAAAAADKVGVWAYKVDNGKYKLSTYATAGSGKAAGKTGAAGAVVELNKKGAVAGVAGTANNDTVYIIEDKDGDVKLYTGVKNAPKSVTLKAANDLMYATNKDGEVTFIYAKTTNVKAATAASDNVYYVLKVGDKKQNDADDNTYYIIDVLVNGAKQSLNVDADLQDAGNGFAYGGVYDDVTINADGIVDDKPGQVDITDDEYEAVTAMGVEDAFKFKSDVFTAIVDNADPSKDEAFFVKTDKVYINVYKTAKALLDDSGATQEFTETTFKGLESFVKGYEIDYKVTLVLNKDDEVTAAYVYIYGATEV